MKTLVTILSMQRVPNHGSFLQSFALKQLLSRKNTQIRFLDIQPGISNRLFCNVSSHEYSSCKQLGSIPGRLLVKSINRKQNRIFQQQAQTELGLLSTKMDDDSCDLAVIGSDEVFNCCAQSPWGFSTQLFGNIPGAAHVASYAASCGQSEPKQIPQAYHSALTQALQRMEAISVRDGNTKTLVQYFQNKLPVEQHLDPVLIYDFSPHVRPCPFTRKFLLLYSYNNRIHRKEEIAAIRTYAQKNGLEIVCAGCFQYWCKYNIPVDSFELLGYFQAADCVVTDTFHGTILSVVFHKRFASILRDSNRNKLGDLLQRLRLTDHRLEQWEQLSSLLQTVPDYSQTQEILQKEKARTTQYLQHLLDLTCRKNEIGGLS